MPPRVSRTTPLQLWLARTCVVASLSANAIVTAVRNSRSTVERGVTLTSLDARAEHWNRLFGLYDINGDELVSKVEFATLHLALEALIAAKPSDATWQKSDESWTSRHGEAAFVEKTDFIEGYSKQLDRDGVNSAKDMELFPYLEHHSSNFALSYAPSHLALALQMASEKAEAPLASEQVDCVQHWCEQNCDASSSEALNECCGNPLNINDCLPYKVKLLEMITGEDGDIMVLEERADLASQKRSKRPKMFSFLPFPVFCGFGRCSKAKTGVGNDDTEIVVLDSEPPPPTQKKNKRKQIDAYEVVDDMDAPATVDSSISLAPL
eukprot:TRINITY_DN3046_c0_g1_i1.p1 TRINITY_DN3046_c0_g1~~TRINITY_DN3046_c0_g1_i1.p1  ORF type:complete len:323 (-),score=53.36 TRINITY_DN3046_c0_g1_i1:242-1210(-)